MGTTRFTFQQLLFESEKDLSCRSPAKEPRTPFPCRWLLNVRQRQPQLQERNAGRTPRSQRVDRLRARRGERDGLNAHVLFAFKKFVSYWLMPLPFCLVAVGVGLALMRWGRSPRYGWALSVGAVVLLMLLSNKLVSRALIRPLESRYPAMPEFAPGKPIPPQLAACRFVVVLGGGNGYSPETSAINLLSNAALARVAEAVRILHALPEAKLIVSGPPIGTGAAHATVLARAAESLGIAAERVLYIDHARDTEEEAQAVSELVNQEPVALVTSAWHLPRSMALFRAAGVRAVAVPADFRTHVYDPWGWNDLGWDLAALERSSLALRERLGFTWAWLRGKTAGSDARAD